MDVLTFTYHLHIDKHILYIKLKDCINIQRSVSVSKNITHTQYLASKNESDSPQLLAPHSQYLVVTHFSTTLKS